MREEEVILVDVEDRPIGLMPKMEAHEKALLHRAFSIFIMNDRGETLIQQRAQEKYHSPLLWSNSCCSHQREGEDNIQAGKRRLMEEMGFETELRELFSFIYKAPFDNGLTEHEYDHVMIGKYNKAPNVNPEEVADWKWMLLSDIKRDIGDNLQRYTAWIKIIFERFYDHITSNNSDP